MIGSPEYKNGALRAVSTRFTCVLPAHARISWRNNSRVLSRTNSDATTHLDSHPLSLPFLLLVLPVSAGAATTITGPTVITEPGATILDPALLTSGAGTSLKMWAWIVVIEGHGHRSGGVWTGPAWYSGMDSRG